MTQRNLSFYPKAVQDAETAIDWYAERSQQAARAFVRELTLAVQRVKHFPNRWPRFGKNTRRYIFPRFPFSLIYRIKDRDVEVIAVAHDKRKPGYWKSR